MHKGECFLVNITIIEGRHFIWPNMDSFVLVRVANQKRCTPIKHNTDCPFFNEYFVFEFNTILESLLEKNITLTVVQPRKLCRRRKILGYIALDLATVWNQPDHQFYHKWAVLTASTKEPASGTRGYLKVDISITAKGEAPLIPAGDTLGNDDIEGNLLLPEGINSERQRATYVFKVYRGEGIKCKTSSVGSCIKSGLEKDTPSCYVEIHFVGISVKTTTQKATSDPVWNEKLTITELFPPLCQRIKIELKHLQNLHTTVCAVRYIDLRNISNDEEHGFLPCYGPSFLFFYSQDAYVGKILLSISTQIDEDVACIKKSSAVTTMPPLNEASVLKYENVLLFAAIVDVAVINKEYADKPISIQISAGPCNKQESHPEGTHGYKTVGQKPQTHDNIYWYLPFAYEKPCLSLISMWPDSRRRMYNSNMINKIATNMKSHLDEIEELFEDDICHRPSEKIENISIKMLDSLSSECLKFLDIVQSQSTATETDLDKNRFKLCERQIKQIEEKSKNIYNPRTKKKSFRNAQKIYEKLLLLEEEAQDCWPDVFVTIMYGNKRIACHRIPAKDVAYSVISEECGKYCGVIQNKYFTATQKKAQKLLSDKGFACRVELFLWMGLERHKEYCLNTLPSAYNIPSSVTATAPGSIPPYLICVDHRTFSCRAHIYQAHVSPGADESGLCDAFVRVTIGHHSRQTKVQKSTLNPVWDQCLLFNGVKVCGSSDYIKEHPPYVLLQLFDQDECCRVEYLGYAEALPIVKTIEEPYSAPNFPPKLKWYKMHLRNESLARMLVTIELLEESGVPDDNDKKDAKELVRIPSDIKPMMVSYRIEIMFWGVRNLKKVHLVQISKPKIAIEVLDSVLHSNTLINSHKSLNFPEPIKFMDTNLPNQEEYAPPLCMKMYDCRSFGRYTYAGIHISSLHTFIYRIWEAGERNKKINGFDGKSYDSLDSKTEILTVRETLQSASSLEQDKKHKDSKEKKKKNGSFWSIRSLLGKSKSKKLPESKKKNKLSPVNSTLELEEEDGDWWTKYYGSLSTDEKGVKFNKEDIMPSLCRLKIYANELEKQPEFNNFTDTLKSFAMYKGKKTGDEIVDEENITGIFKGAIAVYRWPPENNLEYVTESGVSVSQGVFQDFPLNDPFRYLVRIYCVKGISLRPKDANGKSDPYLRINMNNKVINDRKNYIKKQLNPTFGKCFELEGTFPNDHSVTISVWDYDVGSGDDLIGETHIDLENRYFTVHRARCGLALEYKEVGYCTWRDHHKPSHILEGLCNKYNLELPEYGDNVVKIANKEFVCPEKIDGEENKEIIKENQSLAVLHRWHEFPMVGRKLVPEHVETRSLYHPLKPGVEQGKLQVWIDIFPMTDLPPPMKVDISPRKSIMYELRAIIWNTQDVLLQEDDFFLGEKVSDIYCLGWLTSRELAQSTDVHYRSLTGEGNFNWRFLFRFEYLSTENKMVIRKKDSAFSSSDTEEKLPCKLNLQVWDNDTISRDDFIGSVSLELYKLPRPAKTPQACTLNMLSEGAPTINLFKAKRTKGWWPFRGTDEESEKEILTGKVEIEFELVTEEEADKDPVGLGRSEPHALPKPNRPDTSFSWLRNPLKALKYTVCKLYKWKIIKCVIFLLLIGVMVLGVYSLPGYSVKKLLGV